MLTVKQVAAILAISPTAVRELIRAGDLRAVNVAPRTSTSHAMWRIEVGWVGEFLSQRQAATGPVHVPRLAPAQPAIQDRTTRRSAPDYLGGAQP